MRSINEMIKDVDVTAGLVDSSEIYMGLEEMLDKSLLHQTLLLEVGEDYLENLYNEADDSSIFIKDILYYFVTKLKMIAEPFFEEVSVEVSEKAVNGVFLITTITSY